MICSKNHSIVLKNLSENYFHKIVLLNGEVNSCDHQSMEIESEKIKIFNKTFKHLIELHEGINEIKLKYCNEVKVIKLKFIKFNIINYDIQPLYIIPKNHEGNFQGDSKNSPNDASQKINLAMKLTQCVMGTKFIEQGHDGMSFELRDCEIFNSSLTVEHVRDCEQFQLYDELAEELLKTFGSEIIKRRKFIGFISCTKFLGLDDDEKYSYENIKRKTQANPALGMGFLALLGSGTFYSFPSELKEVQNCLSDKKFVDIKKQLDDSNYRKTYGGNFSTSIGSMLHEIGHVFDLGHTENGIMGNDVDYVHRFFNCENFTEIMPKRSVSKCQKIELKNVSNVRLTKIRKGGEYLEKYRQQKNNDMTFFEPNCMLTLIHHRWFTQENKNDVVVEFDESEKNLKSNDFLVMVELRNSEALLIKFYDLTKKSTKEFKIPSEINFWNVSIFAITKTGFIFKKLHHR